ncbi:hypothetical protein E2C01_036319 [Portunus trituberculatus]|uniref:Uncharacterized protein n=1 Tax=Portunus trituberculatus TaxID=210409 RepID=A0A5B7F8F1_PORTR|nr:hypothetical protein [Portunus trituberculatus]
MTSPDLSSQLVTSRHRHRGVTSCDSCFPPQSHVLCSVLLIPPLPIFLLLLLLLLSSTDRHSRPSLVFSGTYKVELMAESEKNANKAIE